jgi:hypothetical protein
MDHGWRARISQLIRITLLTVALSGLVAIHAPVAAAPPEHITSRVLVLDFDPLLDNGVPLTVDRFWSDPLFLDGAYATAVANASGGIVEQRIARTNVIRGYPVKDGGFTFTNAQYLGCLSDSSAPYCDDMIDYPALLNTAYDARLGSACDAIAKRRIDEVWLWGGPWFGYWEYQIVDPNTMCPGESRRFVVMGFSYERVLDDMLHDLGHRAEALVQGGVGFEIWDRFDGQRARYGQDFACPPEPDATHPEVTDAITHAGNDHFPPNAYCHYQYDRDHPVVSDADDWPNFPNLTGQTTVVNASTWGGTKESFMMWWLGHMPRHPGSSNGVLHDWWRYIYPAGRSPGKG